MPADYPAPIKERPHAVWCIKESVANLLRAHCGESLTISCDRDDCWSDEELFKHRQAVNIAMGRFDIGESFRAGGKDYRSRSDDNTGKHYKSSLQIQIQIYVERCDCDEDPECLNSVGKAYSILAHITSVIANNKSSILGTSVSYEGAARPDVNSKGEVFVTRLVTDVEIEFTFDPNRPWAV